MLLFFIDSIAEIVLLQHGESDMNVSGKIGGDGALSQNGREVTYILH